MWSSDLRRTSKTYLIAAAAVLATTGFIAMRSGLFDDPKKAWAEIQADWSALRGLADDPVKMKEGVDHLADKSAAFVRKFPKDSVAEEARWMRLQLLSYLAKAGNTDREEELSAVLDMWIPDKSLPDHERVRMYPIKYAQLPVMKKLRENPRGVIDFDEEMARATTDALLAAQKEFPSCALVYSELLIQARNARMEEGNRIAEVIASANAAPADVKTMAQDLLDGKRSFELGKALDIKFIAVDGREVDLSKMTGKVVLIDFWSTGCGPCVAEMPNVKAVYDKYQEKGFEIIGISLDDDKEALVNFVADKKLPWPQYFDGKGWQNDYAVRFFLTGIPTLWLVDKDGNLADLNARGNLEQKVTRLLEEVAVP